ncbi:MAG: nitroreductase [Candidatus Nitrosopolaris wilkensis]|nr:MAG: nitroreductase [Candidatus Nitrosopolaris wilkensis]
MQLSLSARELLTTTRAVRKRLDITRPVEREVIEECVAIAQQAPTSSNTENQHFVIVTDPIKKSAPAELFRRGWETYVNLPKPASKIKFEDPERNGTQSRVASSAEYLRDHLQEVPVHVIPCIAARTEGMPTVMQSEAWGSIAPAVWSFMLADRSFGLGTSWTILHLFYEQEAASILNIPFKEVMQVALIPVGYTKGIHFKSVPREPVSKIVHWNGW